MRLHVPSNYSTVRLMKAPKRRKVSRSNAWRVLATVLFVVSFAVVSTVYFRGLKRNNEPVVVGIQDNSIDVPANERKPSAKQVSNYVVPPDMPRYLNVESLGITDARILALGISGDGAVATPSSIYDVGWFDGSAKPGTGGVSLIVGHVSGVSAAGVFGSIHTLNAGDMVEVELGNGDVLSYRVDGVEPFPADKVDMSRVLQYNPNGAEGLNLITCFGSFDSARQQYRERLVVYTTRI